MFLVSSCSCLCPIHWSHMSSWEWRCRWSSADRRCSNYIWAINNFIAYQGESYIRDFTVRFPVFTSLSSDLYMAYYNKFYLGICGNMVLLWTQTCFVYQFEESQFVNTLRPRQNGRHFADDIFKCILLNENVWITIKNSLKFVPKGPINNMPALVQIMAWRRPGDKPLSESMLAHFNDAYMRQSASMS